MKAVGYVRVSTEEQVKGGVSLDMQRAKIQTYASLEDMELVGIEADEGISGCNLKDRPGIQKILETEGLAKSFQNTGRHGPGKRLRDYFGDSTHCPFIFHAF